MNTEEIKSPDITFSVQSISCCLLNPHFTTDDEPTFHRLVALRNPPHKSSSALKIPSSDDHMFSWLYIQCSGLVIGSEHYKESVL